MNLDWVILLIATIVGSALGAWIQGRFSEAGRIRAITSHIDQVMSQARERSRAEEEGKRIATHEDIENVLREVTLVTKQTEQVRTDIASAVWEHQNAWNLKRDMYVQLLNDLGNVFVDASKAVWVYEKVESQPLNDELIRHARTLDEQLQSSQRSISCIIRVPVSWSAAKQRGLWGVRYGNGAGRGVWLHRRRTRNSRQASSKRYFSFRTRLVLILDSLHCDGRVLRGPFISPNQISQLTESMPMSFLPRPPAV